jgi:hypothetical protein
MIMNLRIFMFGTRDSARVFLWQMEKSLTVVCPLLSRIVKEWTALRHDALVQNWAAARTDGKLERIAGPE